MSFDYDVDFESDIWSIIKAIFDFGIEDIFNEIKAALKGMLPDVDWDLVDEILHLHLWCDADRNVHVRGGIVFGRDQGEGSG